MKKSSNKNVHYPLRSDSYYVKIRSPSSTEKVQIDQNKNNIGQPLSKRSTKTRWPLAELTAEMAYSTGNRTSMENLHQPQHAKDDAFYDFYSDREEDDDTKSLGRRKNKKNKCYHKNDNDEKYPKLESVLEDTGYIELKVSSSKESKRSTGPKSCRRKDKKTPRDYL
uniref:Uncharacterized protein n=1 Tax=Panagrolaimus sp. PS1159 TaxID=55785 RepID=A0AC35GCJ7_9BILA